MGFLERLFNRQKQPEHTYTFYKNIRIIFINKPGNIEEEKTAKTNYLNLLRTSYNLKNNKEMVTSIPSDKQTLQIIEYPHLNSLPDDKRVLRYQNVNLVLLCPESKEEIEWLYGETELIKKSSEKTFFRVITNDDAIKAAAEKFGWLVVPPPTNDTIKTYLQQIIQHEKSITPARKAELEATEVITFQARAK